MEVRRNNMAEQSLTQHWRCLLACFLLCLSPLQYGLDFGLIGGFQVFTVYMLL